MSLINRIADYFKNYRDALKNENRFYKKDREAFYAESVKNRKDALAENIGKEDVGDRLLGIADFLTEKETSVKLYEDAAKDKKKDFVLEHARQCLMATAGWILLAIGIGFATKKTAAYPVTKYLVYGWMVTSVAGSLWRSRLEKEIDKEAPAFKDSIVAVYKDAETEVKKIKSENILQFKNSKRRDEIFANLPGLKESYDAAIEKERTQMQANMDEVKKNGANIQQVEGLPQISTNKKRRRK